MLRSPAPSPRTLAAIFTAAALLAYANSFGVPFLFDDKGAILDNPTIRSLWPPSQVLSPPFAHGETVGGRPLLNLSFALNFAFGGTSVPGYHGVNLLLHLAGAFALFDLVRRTLGLHAFRAGRTSIASIDSATATRTTFAATAAGLWLLHPLQTESVTYLSQRAESLVALCYLLTLLCVARAAEHQPLNDPGPGNRSANAGTRWLAAGVVCCALGMTAKEVMVSAPLLVLLYDRTFVAGSFRAAWQARRLFYGALALTWLPLAWLVASTHGRGGTAGTDVAGMNAWTYLLTQCDAIPRYLGLAFWPRPLVFDYGTGTMGELSAVAGGAAFLVALLAATLVALVRWPVAGFLGAVFFAVLAPSSSFVPVATQTIAEHRMYLPLATALVGLAWLAHVALGRRAVIALAALALPLLLLTARRNADYRSAATLWADTVAKRPTNHRAQNNLALVHLDAGRFPAAIAHAENALRLDPRFAEARNNLAVALDAVGRRGEALAQLSEALRLQPRYAEAHSNLGKVLMADRARIEEALAAFRRALELAPDLGEAHNNLGLALVENGRAAEALPHARRAVELTPHSARAQNNLGIALARNARFDESFAAFARAARLEPAIPNIQENWAKALLLAGRNAEANEHFARAARLRGGR